MLLVDSPRHGDHIMAMSMRLTGDKELKRFMKRLPKKVKKVQRSAVSAMATPVLKQARKNAPKRTGTLRKSLGKKSRTYKSGTVIAVVGPRNGKGVMVNGKWHDPAKIAHIVESRNPFLEPAMDSRAGEAQQVYTDKLRERIQVESKKAAAKARAKR